MAIRSGLVCVIPPNNKNLWSLIIRSSKSWVEKMSSRIKSNCHHLGNLTMSTTNLSISEAGRAIAATLLSLQSKHFWGKHIIIYRKKCLGSTLEYTEDPLIRKRKWKCLLINLREKILYQWKGTSREKYCPGDTNTSSSIRRNRWTEKRCSFPVKKWMTFLRMSSTS